MKGKYYHIWIYLFIIKAISSHQIFYNIGNTNDTIFQPKMKTFRVKSGAPVSFTCHGTKDDISWGFKSCESNYRGIYCGNDDIGTFTAKPKFWKNPHYNDGKKILRVNYASLDDIGIYYCISGNIVRKIFILDVIGDQWPPPQVTSVIASHNIVHVNSYLTINCSVSSQSPPKILWFRECWTDLCEIDFNTYNIHIQNDSNCLCLINNTNDNNYNRGNLYISKLHVFNVHIADRGTYVCSALSAYGKDYKSVTIEVFEVQRKESSISSKSYLILLLIPIILILLYIVSYLFCTTKHKESDSDKQLQTKCLEIHNFE